MKRIIKIRPSNFRSLHLNPNNVTENPKIISISNAREQMAPAEETATWELLRIHVSNHGKGFLKIFWNENIAYYIDLTKMYQRTIKQHILVVCSYKNVWWKMFAPKPVDTAMFPFPFLTTNTTLTIIGIPNPKAANVIPVT